jgi:proline-rich tail region repeat protein
MLVIDGVAMISAARASVSCFSRIFAIPLLCNLTLVPSPPAPPRRDVIVRIPQKPGCGADAADVAGVISD